MTLFAPSREPALQGRSRHRVLRVGPLAIALSGGCPHEIQERYDGFFDDGPADLRLTLEEAKWGATGADTYAPAVRLLGDVLTVKSSVIQARIDFGRGDGWVRLARHPRFGSTFYLENTLRQVVQVLAIRRGHILVHAAAVVTPFGAEADLFLGRSGAGKTTISELLRRLGGRVLSDDLVLLHGADARVSQTPFFGDLKDPSPGPRQSYPIRSAHVLERSPSPTRRPLEGSGVTVAHWIANLPFTECLDGDGRRASLAIAVAVATRVQLYSLAFRRDASLVQLLEWKGVDGHELI